MKSAPREIISKQTADVSGYGWAWFKTLFHAVPLPYLLFRSQFETSPPGNRWMTHLPCAMISWYAASNTPASSCFLSSSFDSTSIYHVI